MMALGTLFRWGHVSLGSGGCLGAGRGSVSPSHIMECRSLVEIRKLLPISCPETHNHFRQKKLNFQKDFPRAGTEEGPEMGGVEAPPPLYPPPQEPFVQLDLGPRIPQRSILAVPHAWEEPGHGGCRSRRVQLLRLRLNIGRNGTFLHEIKSSAEPRALPAHSAFRGEWGGGAQHPTRFTPPAAVGGHPRGGGDRG